MSIVICPDCEMHIDTDYIETDENDRCLNCQEVTAEQVKHALSNHLHTDTWDEQLSEIWGVSDELILATVKKLDYSTYKYLATTMSEAGIAEFGAGVTWVFSWFLPITEKTDKEYEQIGHIISEWVYTRREQ